MSLLETIAELATDTVTVTRPGTGTRTLGRWALGSTTSVPSVVICLQPPGGRSLRVLAEGQRADDTRVFFTETPILIDDRLPIAGETFEVFHVDTWELDEEVFYKASCSRLVLP